MQIRASLPLLLLLPKYLSVIARCTVHFTRLNYLYLFSSYSTPANTGIKVGVYSSLIYVIYLQIMFRLRSSSPPGDLWVRQHDLWIDANDAKYEFWDMFTSSSSSCSFHFFFIVKPYLVLTFSIEKFLERHLLCRDLFRLSFILVH